MAYVPIPLYLFTLGVSFSRQIYNVHMANLLKHNEHVMILMLCAVFVTLLHYDCYCFTFVTEMRAFSEKMNVCLV